MTSPPAPTDQQPICADDGCNEMAVKKGDTGPPRRYCSGRCRQAAYRARHANPKTTASVATDPIDAALDHLNTLFWELPPQSRQGVPSDAGTAITKAIRHLQGIQRWQEKQRR